MDVSRSDWDWIKSHGRFEVCKETGAPINILVTGRSIWIPGLMGGPGEVRQVAHFWCTKCDKEPDVSYGKPIYENELVSVG